MRFELTFLRSQVARRVFVRFVLAAIIPVTATTLLVVNKTRDTLEQQSYVQLRAASKAIGQSIYERLTFVERATGDLASKLRESRARAKQLLSRENSYFSNARLVTDPGEATPALRKLLEQPMSASATDHLAGAGVIVSWLDEPGQDPALIMRRSFYSARPDLGMLVAEVNLDYLWGDPDSLPFVMDFCVLALQGEIVHCTANKARVLAEQMPAKDAQSAQGQFPVQYDDEKYLASYWQVFLAPRYLSPSWTVVAIRAEANILAPIAVFNSIFAPMILLSVVLVAFLSISQIRKILVPLDRLIRGTRQIAEQDFDSAIEVSSGDEFEELATSMNDMARNLGTQFLTLQTLSEVDRLILSRADIETVVETVLVHLRKASDYAVASLIVLDEDSDTAARMFVDNLGEELVIERIMLPDQQRKLLSNGTVQLFDATDAKGGFLAPLVDLGARSLFVLPIVLGGRLSAIVSLGYSESSVPPREKMEQVREFADRISVALRAAEREEQLHRQAHYDPLTGLPNRQLFKDRLRQSIAQANRENRKGALLFIDLDRFKVVNDSQGHTVGDELLKEAASRLQAYVSDADTVARLGGDEFTVVLSNITSTRAVSKIADELVELLSEQFSINNLDLFISASIGVTIYPDDGVTVEDLLKNADTAMYRAKAGGRCGHTFFTDQMNVEAMERHQLESDLHSALQKNQFFLVYQPQVELSSQTLVSAEALIRWRHPDRGLVSPVQFIPLAEDTGHIESIGRWVLKTACEQYRSWQSQGIELDRIAVNVSPVQFTQSDFVATVCEVLAETKLSPSCLELEITENLLLDDTSETLKTLKTLHDMDIRIAIDDFGTGYSSMSYLNRLSFDILKIDRSFVIELGVDEDAVAVVRAISALAHSLRKEIVAEGIATPEHQAILGQMRCEYGQGELYSMPVSPEEFVTLTQSWNRRKAS